MENTNPQINELHDFIEFLFGGMTGYAYLGTLNPQDRTDWTVNYYSYPEDVLRLEQVILSDTSTKEVYLAPALYWSNNDQPTKENYKCSHVVWTEFDGNAPDEDTYFAKPSYRLQSSTEDKQHVYWRLTEPVNDADTLERINKDITYALAADSSAWDSTQVLRPPFTINHKYPEKYETRIIAQNNIVYDKAVFSTLPEAPKEIDRTHWKLEKLPDVQTILMTYAITPDIIKLLTRPIHEIKDRSASLMNLAYGTAQIGMSDAEIFVLLLAADDRWGKFKDRKDRHKRLAHIITVARHKHPAVDDTIEQYLLALDFATFLDTEISVDWVIQPMLIENGSMLLVGPSGIGKTQMSLRFMIHLALGRNFLDYNITKQHKILFFSLEISFVELQLFVQSMANTLSPEDHEVLAQNLILIPHGEKLALNTSIGQAHFLRAVEEFEPDGVFIDSIGSAIQGSISDDETIQGYLDFVDRVRKKYGIFMWAIHHMRKSTNGGNMPASQDDVYGNQYLVNRASSCYGLLFARDGLIRVRNFKNRLSPKEKDYYLKRLEGLDFEKVNFEGVAIEEISYSKANTSEQDKGPEGPVQHGKFSM